ncbi:hypothetical protein KEJ37_05690 [Candidatus Bathyarchaeota archaeon]|nr:hypothetical protein [Candidatus Bathyarchaeota archaeon]
MGKIGELIEEAWSNLLKDCINEVFRPENEYDIQAHLYHYLWTKLRKFKNLIIRAEHSFKKKESTKHIDLVILKKGRKGNINQFWLLKLKSMVAEKKVTSLKIFYTRN